jgi:hypothetical protein
VTGPSNGFGFRERPAGPAIWIPEQHGTGHTLGTGQRGIKTGTVAQELGEHIEIKVFELHAVGQSPSNSPWTYQAPIWAGNLCPGSCVFVPSGFFSK